MKKELLSYVPLAAFLKDALGERYHVALIDAEAPNIELKITERGIAESDTGESDFGGILSDILNGTELKKRDYLCSFADPERDDAEYKRRKNSVFIIRKDVDAGLSDTNRETGINDGIAGFLCICERENGLYMVSEVLEQVLMSEGQESTGSERIGAEIDSILRERILKVWKRHNSLTGKMKKADKIAFISELFEMGIFRMKGGAAHVSGVTGISQASVYRYLSEVLED